MAVICLVFAITGAANALAGIPWGGAGFSIAAGIAGMFAGFSHGGDSQGKGNDGGKDGDDGHA